MRISSVSTHYYSNKILENKPFKPKAVNFGGVHVAAIEYLGARGANKVILNWFNSLYPENICIHMKDKNDATQGVIAFWKSGEEPLENHEKLPEYFKKAKVFPFTISSQKQWVEFMKRFQSALDMYKENECGWTLSLDNADAPGLNIGMFDRYILGEFAIPEFVVKWFG